MNLKFLKEINLIESDDNKMASDEMASYLSILYKKCNKAGKVEFNEYLKEQCGIEDADLKKCSVTLCDDEDYSDIVKHLEEISNRIDESSLTAILEKKTKTKKTKVERDFKDVDCSCLDELDDDAKEYCKNKLMVKYMSDFTIANN